MDPLTYTGEAVISGFSFIFASKRRLLSNIRGKNRTGA